MTRRVCDLFFILGALTQFFDFYTVPVITLCFPLTVLLAAIRNEPAKKRFSTAALTVLAWLSAYVLVWAARLTLVELFTEDAAFTAAFSKFTSWTGIVDDGVHSAFTPAKTASLVFQQLFTPQNIFCLSLMVAVWVFAMVRALVRKTVRTPRPLLLLVAVIPVIWMLAASRATGNHFWFQ